MDLKNVSVSVISISTKHLQSISADPPDARIFQSAQAVSNLGVTASSTKSITDFMRYYDLYGIPNATNDLTLDKIRAMFLPYRYGYITEMNVTAPGKYSATKHYAMGRASHELAYCLPDAKTCFITG